MQTDLSEWPAEEGRWSIKSFWQHPLLRLLIIVLILELTIFQWSAFIPVPVDGLYTVPHEKMVLVGFTQDSSRPQMLTADDGKVHSITVPLSGQAVRTLYLDAYSNRPGPLAFQASVIDQASAVHYLVAEGEVVSGIHRSRTLLLWPSGDVQSIRMTFPLQAGEQLHLNRLILNRRVAYQPSLSRVLLWMLLGVLVHALLTSPLFLRKANVNDVEQRLVMFTLGFLVFVSCMWLTIASSTAPFFNVSKTSGDIYNKELADALINRQIDLLVDPPPGLQQLDNPYDPAQRSAIPTDSILWDAAYYNGRYYVSYGIVPAILILAPFKAVSGYYFQTPWAVFLFGAVGLLFLMRILRRFLFFFFPRLTFRYHFLLSMVIPAVSYVGWGLARPKFYELAIVSGFFFVMLGLDQLAFVAFGRSGRPDRSLFREAILASQSGDQQATAVQMEPEYLPVGSSVDNTADSAEGNTVDSTLSSVPDPSPLPEGSESVQRIPSAHLFLASLFFATSIGCHPALLFTFIPFMAILAYLFKQAHQTRQKLEVFTFSVMPVFAVFFLLALYNQARFGSLFAFGSQYRLTITDLQSRGFWAPERILPGFGHYLLTPPVINTIFPFVHFPTGRAFSFSGFLIADGRTVGLLTFPFLSILLAWPFLRRALKAASRTLRIVFTVSLVTALLMLAYHSMANGAVGRYAIDFGLWLAIPAMLAWLLLIDGANKKGLSDRHFKIFLIAVGLTLFICLMLFLQGENDRIERQTPILYEWLRRTLSFWLP